MKEKKKKSHKMYNGGEGFMLKMFYIKQDMFSVNNNSTLFTCEVLGDGMLNQ